MIIIHDKDGVILKGNVSGYTKKNGSLVRSYWRRAALFAASKHHGQKRKNGKTPYMNHTVSVAKILHEEAGISDDVTIIAALLHDTIEDTNTTHDELVRLFGSEVADTVKEVSDNKSLSKNERKRLQVVNAPGMSEKAQAVKIADKIANMRDVIDRPPVPDWDSETKHKFYDHSNAVVSAMKGKHPALRAIFNDQYSKGKKLIS